MRRLHLLLAICVSGLVPQAAHADTTFTLTLSGPAVVVVHEPARFTGRLTLGAAGVPLQPVEIVVDGAVATTAMTGPDGAYEAKVLIRSPGVHKLQAMSFSSSPLHTRSDAVTTEGVDERPSLTVAIERVEGRRVPGQVEVFVTIGGVVAGRGNAGRTVEGAVTVQAPTPCWDPDPCAQVIDEQTQTFVATTGPEGRYGATVGPFRYTARPSGMSCRSLHVVAVASERDAAARDQRQVRVCA